MGGDYFLYEKVRGKGMSVFGEHGRGGRTYQV